MPHLLPPCSLDELRHCYRLSTRFQTRVTSGEIGNTWKYGGADNTAEMDIRRRWFGFVGGLALSKYLNKPWHEGDPDKWDVRHGYGDVGEVDVRTRSRTWHELSIRTNDTRPAVLIRPDRDWDAHSDTFHNLPRLYAIGWQRPDYVRAHGKPLGQGNVFVVADVHLIDISDIPFTGLHSPLADNCGYARM